MKNVLIFGCGDVGVKVKNKLEAEGYLVTSFSDNGAKWENGGEFNGVTVIPPKRICIKSYDYFAIGVYKAVNVIKRQLLSMGAFEEQILIPIKPPRIFENPSKGSEDELILLLDEDYQSEPTKSYSKLNPRVSDLMFLCRLERLKQVLLKNRIPRKKVCVVSGAVIQVFGLRESKEFDDIDIIMTSDLRELYGSGLVIVSDTIEMHPQDKYCIRDDDIIQKAENHFIFDDLKFMHPWILCEYMRANHKEEFDLLCKITADLRGRMEE